MQGKAAVSRRRLPSVTVCLLLILSFLATIDLVFDIVEEVGSQWIYVDDDNTGYEDGSQDYPYNTIQEAIEFGNGNIFVYAGDYEGPVEIQGPLTIQGESRDTTRILGGDGSNFLQKYPAFEISGANNVTIQDVFVSAGWYTIIISGSTNINFIH